MLAIHAKPYDSWQSSFLGVKTNTKILIKVKRTNMRFIDYQNLRELPQQLPWKNVKDWTQSLLRSSTRRSIYLPVASPSP
jgi:hypothetical protein